MPVRSVLLGLLLLSIAVGGCPPPPHTALLLEDSQEEPPFWRGGRGASPCDAAHLYPYHGYHGPKRCTPDSLAVVMRDPAVDIATAGRKDGRRVDLRQAMLTQDSLFYHRGGMALDEVSYIDLRDRRTFGERAKVAGIWAAVVAGIAVLPASSRDSFGEAGESALVGGGIGGVLGLYFGGFDKRKERVHVEDYGAYWERQKRRWISRTPTQDP